MPQPLKPINRHLETITLQDIEQHKLRSLKDLRQDLKSLVAFPVTSNRNSFLGNPFLYHFQCRNLLKCRRQNGQTIYDVYENPDAWRALLDETRKRNRGGRTAAGNVFECFRINAGSVVMFKATTAKYLYSKYHATHVLDPTAGWGGRLLGAWAMGISYTGIDTNTEMISAYESMIHFLLQEMPPVGNLFLTSPPTYQMIWRNCLEVDFSTIPYNFVLTSPPYVNLEVYEHMVPWASDEVYYQEFLLPLWEKCRRHIAPGGYIGFNISPTMYEDAMGYGLPSCDVQEDLKQQMGQKVVHLKTGKKKTDKIYLWHC